MLMGAFRSCAGQVPVDDPLVGEGTSAPDGDVALDEDADETEEQREKRKEAEESFKVGAFVRSLIGRCFGELIVMAKSQDLQLHPRCKLTNCCTLEKCSYLPSQNLQLLQSQNLQLLAVLGLAAT